MQRDFTSQPKDADIKSLMEQRTRDLNARFGAPEYTPLGAFFVDDAGTVTGGVVGSVSGSWLYVDELWVDERTRGQGCGIRLMGAIEQAAVQHGATRAFLGTTSFQAPGFYARLGYRQTGEFAFSTQYSQYLLVRESLIPYALPEDGPTPTVESPPTPEHQQALTAGLDAYNERYLGKWEKGMVGAAFLRYEDGQLAGGALGYRMGPILSVSALWVAESARASDHPAALVSDLVAAGREAGCTFALAQTDDPDTVPWFEQAGFASSVRVEDFPGGRTSTFLKRDLV